MTDFTSHPVRAVVTGASRGLGRAVAEALAADGALVVATSRAADDVVLAPDESPGRIIPASLDLSDSSSIARCVLSITSALGGLDLLVNNAGVLGWRGDLLDAPAKDLDYTIAVNLTGVIHLIRGVRPLMGQGSAIVNVSSGAAARPGWAGYAVSKAGIDAVGTVLRHELAPSGIRVITVNPGGLRTDMRRDAYPDEDPETLPTPDSIAPLFVAIARGEDPGEYVEARSWRP